MNFLAMIPLRWWLYTAVAVLIAGVVWHDHHATHRANMLAAEKSAAIAERDQLAGTIETMKADAALNQETSHALVERLEAVERDRREHPLRLRCYVPAAPVPAEGAAAGGTDDPAARRVDGSADLPTFDAGPGVSEFQRRCAVNAARQVTLQEFEAKRTH